MPKGAAPIDVWPETSIVRAEARVLWSYTPPIYEVTSIRLCMGSPCCAQEGAIAASASGIEGARYPGCAARAIQQVRPCFISPLNVRRGVHHGVMYCSATVQILTEHVRGARRGDAGEMRGLSPGSGLVILERSRDGLS